jgi:bifunctional UDP-N-acetylglucosamine pyrophosphorylase / glucosamine-1-phosphate N-acetyltransferase
MVLFFLHLKLEFCQDMDKKSRLATIMRKVKKDRKSQLLKVFKLMADGVEVRDPASIDIRGTLMCGQGVKLDMNIIIEGEVVLGNDVSVGANSILKSCKIGRSTAINPFSLVDNAVIGEHCFIGPYVRIRPDVSIGDNVQIGNYVEIKNANIASKCRINHLAFVGDADLAENVTIGAGTITCNHDGVGVNRTTIEEGAYVGSGCNLVAPLKVNANATIASGSTITEEVPGDTLTIARSLQVTVKNWQGPKSRK